MAKDRTRHARRRVDKRKQFWEALVSLLLEAGNYANEAATRLREFGDALGARSGE